MEVMGVACLNLEVVEVLVEEDFQQEVEVVAEEEPSYLEVEEVEVVVSNLAYLILFIIIMS
jgi:hypothetical protein